MRKVQDHTQRVLRGSVSESSSWIDLTPLGYFYLLFFPGLRRWVVARLYVYPNRTTFEMLLKGLRLRGIIMLRGCTRLFGRLSGTAMRIMLLEKSNVPFERSKLPDRLRSGSYPYCTCWRISRISPPCQKNRCWDRVSSSRVNSLSTFFGETFGWNLP